MERLQQAGIRLLRWSERYTKTDMVYLVSGSTWLGLSQAGMAISSLVLSIAFARLVPQEVYGTYKYVLSLATLISAFALTGLSTSITQAVARGNESALTKGFAAYVKSGMLIVISGAVIGVYYLANQNLVLGVGMLAAAAALPFIGAATLYDSFLQGKREFKLSGLLSLVNSGVPALVLAALVFFVKDPLPLIIAYFIANTATDMLLYRYVLARFKPVSRGETAEDTRYGAHLSAMNVFSTFAAQVDQLLLFHILGAASVAIYAFAIAIPEQVKGLFKNVGSLAFPKFANQDSSTKRDVLRKTLWLTLFICIPVVAYILLAPIIFHFLFPAYMSAVLYTQIFALSLPTASSVLPQAYLQAKVATRRLYAITLLGGGMQIALIVGFGLYSGLMGVVLGRVLARYFSSALTVALAGM